MSNALRQRFPGYDVLDKWHSPSWNEQTREVIAERIEKVPPRRFLDEQEWHVLEAICERLVPQPDRSVPVPIVPFIDKKLHENEGEGYRYEDMPAMRDAWRRGIAAIEAECRERYGNGFRDLRDNLKDATLRAIQHGNVRSELWRELPPKRFFNSVLLKEAAVIYYAHPAAWNEIGFGGPASPRGYVRLGFDRRDPWEAEERHD